MKTAVKIHELQIGHQKKIHATALNTSFELGNFVVLLGRNGCGKTTFLRTLGRFLKPIDGEISIDDKNISKLSAKEFAQYLSIVSTERVQIPYMKVYDLVALGRYPYLGFWGKLREEDHLVIQQILEDLGIAELAEKYVLDCSDGEQQMTLLARALAQDTPIILLDEATAHLDFVNRIKVFQTLKMLAEKRNKLIFLATHELETALKYAHQVILFQRDNVEVNVPQFFVEKNLIEMVFSEVSGKSFFSRKS